MIKEKEPDQDHPIIMNEYAYTCFFEFEGKNDPSTVMHLQARGVCPTVKLSSYVIQFGDCETNERRDFLLTLENMNEEIPIEFGFQKVAQFNASPKHGKLSLHQSCNVILSFEPKNLGNFQTTMDLELLGFYKIPITVIGTSSDIHSKTVM